MNAVHIFKTLTVAKVYHCHVKCFEERCLCQAFQMVQNRCELLYEDRFSAREDYEHNDVYVYFDLNREYVPQGNVIYDTAVTFLYVDKKNVINWK